MNYLTNQYIQKLILKYGYEALGILCVFNELLTSNSGKIEYDIDTISDILKCDINILREVLSCGLYKESDGYIYPIKYVQPKQVNSIKFSEKHLKLIEWLKVQAPDVLKLKHQLTEEEFQGLCDDGIFDKKGFNILKSMHNKKDLLSKYKSVNLTLRNWYARNQ
jgi:hypothetical protein